MDLSLNTCTELRTAFLEKKKECQVIDGFISSAKCYRELEGLREIYSRYCLYPRSAGGKNSILK